ncbi:MAG TPA: hypothetical protein VND65_10710 [Candidatus Binatia bacterium]|nr:hypothetical protein [Candidatus Binatia bacterium]
MKATHFVCIAAALATIGTAGLPAQTTNNSTEQIKVGALSLREDEAFLLARDFQNQDSAQSGKATDQKSSLPDAPTPNGTQAAETGKPGVTYGKQPKRILGIIPNYRAVSADTHLPPLSFKGELWLATQDTFDYSDFIFVGILSGYDMATDSQPSFGQGAEGYGKYYWHVFVDGGIENYMTEAIVPFATREDPRYYTLGKGGFFKRTGYGLSRLFITRTNSGGNTFNLAEIVGAGAAAGIGNAYYPHESNPFVKTYQRWGTQVGLDGVFNVLKEFWPDIDRAVFHGKY